YERDSHAKVLISFNTVPADKRSDERMQKAADLMSHLVAARMMWLYRLGFLSENTELFPKNTNMEELPAAVARMESAWEEYLRQLNESDLERIFEYQSYEGSRFRNSIADILTQLFGHSWYHRGQIASLIRSLGGE